jgi:hypothetical protein
MDRSRLLVRPGRNLAATSDRDVRDSIAVAVAM